GHGNRWITLRFRGVRSNRLAIGARVHVIIEDEDGTSRHVHRVVGTGGSFGSSSLQLEIGLGRARRVARLEVRWPATGELSVFENIPMDRVVRVHEDSTELEWIDAAPIPLGSRPSGR
ncbi:MAG: ASPIC/UnbV domain-containing protein, partial [Acidobacteriota bacterium]